MAAVHRLDQQRRGAHEVVAGLFVEAEPVKCEATFVLAAVDLMRARVGDFALGELGHGPAVDARELVDAAEARRIF